MAHSAGPTEGLRFDGVVPQITLGAVGKAIRDRRHISLDGLECGRHRLPRSNPSAGLAAVAAWRLGQTHNAFALALGYD